MNEIKTNQTGISSVLRIGIGRLVCMNLHYYHCCVCQPKVCAKIRNGGKKALAEFIVGMCENGRKNKSKLLTEMVLSPSFLSFRT